MQYLKTSAILTDHFDHENDYAFFKVEISQASANPRQGWDYDAPVSVKVSVVDSTRFVVTHAPNYDAGVELAVHRAYDMTNGMLTIAEKASAYRRSIQN